MRLYKNLLFIVIILSSCNSLDEKEIRNEIFSFAFKNYEIENKLEIIDLDSMRSYSELRKEMVRIDCSGKVAGLKFSYDKKNYNAIGFAYCPNINETACYFTPNQFTIKNDSIIRYSNKKNRKPIENLQTELDTAISKKYNFRYEQDKLKPAVIFLYVEEIHPISKTKKVLKEIVEQFKRINSEKSPDYFEYTILFESYSSSDIPPPPQPKVYNINQ